MAILCKQMKCVDGTIIDVEIEHGVITKIADDIPVGDQEVINGFGSTYISSGWIDLHTHCFDKYKLYGDKIDDVGYPNGVTTVVDAGTCGADTIHELVSQIKEAKTNTLAFLNIAACGIRQQNELSDLTNLDAEKLRHAFQMYPDNLIGIKARMSASVLGDSGMYPLQFAIDQAEALKVPLMVHIGSKPADLEDVMRYVRKDDIITHIFNPKENGIMDAQGKVKSFVKQAHEKGVKFDVGHGSESFSFEVCEQALAQGIVCDSISTDIYFRNRQQGPVYDMSTTLNKLRSCGYSLQEVIDRVTIHPAMMLHRPNLAGLKVGNCGDVTFFKLVDEECSLIDSTKETRTMRGGIQPVGVILHQEYIPCKEEQQ